jgi:hypothetical protein
MKTFGKTLETKELAKAAATLADQAKKMAGDETDALVLLQLAASLLWRGTVRLVFE